MINHHRRAARYLVPHLATLRPTPVLVVRLVALRAGVDDVEVVQLDGLGILGAARALADRVLAPRYADGGRTLIPRQLCLIEKNQFFNFRKKNEMRLRKSQTPFGVVLAVAKLFRGILHQTECKCPRDAFCFFQHNSELALQFHS